MSPSLTSKLTLIDFTPVTFRSSAPALALYRSLLLEFAVAPTVRHRSVLQHSTSRIAAQALQRSACARWPVRVDGVEQPFRLAVEVGDVLIAATLMTAHRRDFGRLDSRHQTAITSVGEASRVAC